MKKIGMYLWIDFYSSTGSHFSHIQFAGEATLDRAKKVIDEANMNGLKSVKPNCLEDCIKIRLSCQEIMTGKVLYERTQTF